MKLFFCILISMFFSFNPVQSESAHSYGPDPDRSSEGLRICLLDPQRGINVEWLLNFRGGSFLIPLFSRTGNECLIRGVPQREDPSVTVNQIYTTIEQENMERVLLEKAPKIAVIHPANRQPWDDAVTLAPDLAEIEYDQIYDEEVLAGKLSEYDWLPSASRGFYRQYGKFYASFP